MGIQQKQKRKVVRIEGDFNVLSARLRILRDLLQDRNSSLEDCKKVETEIVKLARKVDKHYSFRGVLVKKVGLILEGESAKPKHKLKRSLCLIENYIEMGKNYAIKRL